MPILTVCPSCRAMVNAPDSLAGMKAKCSACGGVLSVPAADVGGWLQDHVDAAGAPVAPLPRPRPEPKPAAQPPVPETPKPRQKAVRTEPAPPKKDRPAPRPAEEPPPAPKPRKKAAAPEAAPAKEKKSRPSRSFEKLKIPGRIRTRLEKEVGDETIVWMGRPSEVERMRQARLGMIFGIVFILLTPAAFLLLLIEVGEDNRWIMQLSAAGLAAVLFLCFGLPMLLMPFFVRRFMHYRPVYVLTDQRAIVYHNVMIIMGKVHTYDRDDLLSMTVQEGDGGLGSIVMGFEQYQHQGHLHHSSDTRTSEDGKRKVVTSKLEQRGAHTSNIPVGFLDVEGVREVEAIIRRTLKLPAPESE
jgi:hypothetical protein